MLAAWVCIVFSLSGCYLPFHGNIYRAFIFIQFENSPRASQGFSLVFHTVTLKHTFFRQISSECLIWVCLWVCTLVYSRNAHLWSVIQTNYSNTHSMFLTTLMCQERLFFTHFSMHRYMNIQSMFGSQAPTDTLPFTLYHEASSD